MGNSNSGRGGLPRAKRREIIRLLQSREWKNAHIARKVGCDVSTVSRIKRKLREQQQLGGTPEGDVEQAADPIDDTVRCGSCGGSIRGSEPYCRRCYLQKTVLERARQARIARIARARRSQKARIAA